MYIEDIMWAMGVEEIRHQYPAVVGGMLGTQYQGRDAAGNDIAVNYWNSENYRVIVNGRTYEVRGEA